MPRISAANRADRDQGSGGESTIEREGAPAPQASEETFDMDSAPKNGRPVWLHGAEGEREAAVWRVSRAFDTRSMSWKVTARWVMRSVQPPRDIEFQPVAWSVVRD